MSDEQDSVEKGDDRSVVKTLLKGLQILDLVAASNKPLSLTEIAREYGSDVGTVHRFLNTLIKEKFVWQDPDSKRYLLSGKVLALSRMFFSQHRIYDLAREDMLALSGRFEESVQLSVITPEADAVLVDEIAGKGPAVLTLAIGARLPMHCTAQGKVLLAMQEAPIVERILDRIEFVAHTSKTIITRDRLQQELESVRILGYASSREEFVEGLTSIAAPVYNYTNLPVAALAIVCPSSRFGESQLVEMAEPLVRHAANISLKAGFSDTVISTGEPS